MESLSREAIKRMIDGGGSGGSGGSGGDGGGGISGNATQAWVEQYYLSKAFFGRLFTIHGANDTTVDPNDMESTITSIEAMFGFWTDFYLTALGNGGSISAAVYLSQLADVALSNPTDGQALIYDSATGKWKNGNVTSGTVTQVKVGTTPYNPVAGVVSLPAYPTVPTNLSSFTNDVGYITSSGSCAYAASAGIANKVYMTSHIGTWWMNSQWDGTYFWITGQYESSSLPCAVSYASNANYASYAGSASNASFYINGSTSDNPRLVLHIPGVHYTRIQMDNNGDLIVTDEGSPSTYRGITCGCLYSTNYVTALSDIRKKDVVGDFDLRVADIAGASLIRFTWKDKHDEDIHVGGIAQEWKKLLPESVREDADGTLSMDYGVIAVAASVSIARKVVAQERIINAQGKKIAELEKRLARLERMFAIDINDIEEE